MTPITPPPVARPLEVKQEAMAVQHGEGHQDLPSPPSSVTKTHSSNAHQEHFQASDADSEQAGEKAESPLPSSSSNVPPPSPPPSTHSSEDMQAPIQPSYFYPQPSDTAATVTSVGSADEAPGIPVFEPTWDEFQDFYTFCQRIDEWGMKCGIVKIVPPREWVEGLPRLDGKQGHTSSSSTQASSGVRYTEGNPLSQIRIKNSIEQIFTPAGSGSWRQSNVVHPARVINAKQWADLCAGAGQKGPEMSRMKDNAKREGEEGGEEEGVRTRSGRGNRTAATSSTGAVGKRKRSVEAETPRGPGTVETEQDAATEEMPALEDAEPSSKARLRDKIADRTTQQEWDDFDYVGGWCAEAGQGCEPSDWSPRVCKAIESEYWRGLNFGKAPMYGADLKGTLFTPATRHWNVGCLDNILTRLRLRRKLPGVTTPYLYFGMWRATFAWHVEDMDLYSINYIHFGAPKQWYAIRQSDRQRFELAMAGAFPGDSARCRHFMRHKSYLASPAFLAATAGIKPLRLVQKAQEFVITYPYGYHSGFNLGFNCAESVNFALESWLDIGRKAGYCDCANDSVKMDVDAMLEESKEMEELDRKREEKERKKEAEDKMIFSEQQRLEARRAKERERRRARKEEQARLLALGIHPSAANSDRPPAKKARTQQPPCVFCPSTLDDDLVVVPHTEGLVRRAHRLCACFLPETWVGPNPQWEKGSQEPKEVVMGFEGIEKARWALKCQNCVDPSMAKKGAKVQCTYGKCSRTTHVSCALQLSSGWMLDVLADRAEANALEGIAPKATNGKTGKNEDDEPGGTAEQQVETEDDGAPRIVILCRSHNPHEREREAQRREEVLRLCVESLAVGQTIKVRTSSGMWETTLKEISWASADGEEESVVAEEDQVIKWSKILFSPEAVKKAEEEQKRREEIAAAADQQAQDQSSHAAQVGEVQTSEDVERKRQAKAEEYEAREAAKRAKEARKAEKAAEREAKAVEKEARAAERLEKAKVREQNKAEREAKAALRKAKAEAKAAQKQTSQTSSGQVASVPSRPMLPDYIRQWRPAQRPSLPTHSTTGMDRVLAPIWHMTNGPGQYSEAGSYPAHLATYQSRPYGAMTTYQQPPPQAQVRHLPPISHMQYASQYQPRPSRPVFAYHQGQGQGQYPPTPTQPLASTHAHPRQQQQDYHQPPLPQQIARPYPTASGERTQ